MLLKVIDENKVKILVEDKDILQYDLPFEKLNYNDKASREFILELIRKTYEQTGVDFMDSKVLIKAIPGAARSYYILFTRLEPGSEQQISFDKAARNDTDVYIFKLFELRDLFTIAGQFEKNSGILASKSRIYFYRGAYYLVLEFASQIVSDTAFETFICTLGEFAERCRWNMLNDSLLSEWGTLIAGDDVIDKAMLALKNKTE